MFRIAVLLALALTGLPAVAFAQDLPIPKVESVTIETSISDALLAAKAARENYPGCRLTIVLTDPVTDLKDVLKGYDASSKAEAKAFLLACIHAGNNDKKLKEKLLKTAGDPKSAVALLEEAYKIVPNKDASLRDRCKDVCLKQLVIMEATVKVAPSEPKK